MEATYVSINRGMDKEDVVYTHTQYIYNIYVLQLCVCVIMEYYSTICNKIGRASCRERV